MSKFSKLRQNIPKNTSRILKYLQKFVIYIYSKILTSLLNIKQSLRILKHFSKIRHIYSKKSSNNSQTFVENLSNILKYLKKLSNILEMSLRILKKLSEIRHMYSNIANCQ